MAKKDAEWRRWAKLHSPHEHDKEQVADAIERLDKLADLLADSLELRVGETPAVQTINEVLDILGEVGK